MSNAIIVTGTDTGIGKTIAAAALVTRLAADYWKPIQAGLDGETDRDTVIRLANLPQRRAHQEAYRLTTPASPHLAAEIDAITIDPARLALPATTAPLVVEAAGGLLVPIKRDLLQIDVIAAWKRPVVLVASTRLGTINHTLLSVESLQKRSIPIAGLLFNGDANADTQRTIADFTGIAIMGRLPRLNPLDCVTLTAAAASYIDVSTLVDAWGPTP